MIFIEQITIMFAIIYIYGAIVYNNNHKDAFWKPTNNLKSWKMSLSGEMKYLKAFRNGFLQYT